MDDEAWQQFISNALNVTLDVRPVTRAGDAVAMQLQGGQTRGGAATDIYLYFDDVKLTTGTEELVPEEAFAFAVRTFPGGGIGWSRTNDLPTVETEHRPPGTLPFGISGRVRVVEPIRGPANTMGIPPEHFADDVALEKRLTVQGMTMIQSPGTPLSTLAGDEHRDAMLAAVTASDVVQWPFGNEKIVRIAVKDPPARLTATPWFRPAGDESAQWLPITTSSYSTATPAIWYEYMFNPPGVAGAILPSLLRDDVTAIDLELRPDPDAARRDTDASPFWNETIRFENLPVLRGKQPYPPATPHAPAASG